jgi:transposase
MSISHSKYYIGIDVSKATLDVFILPLQRYHQCPNTPLGIRELLQVLKPFKKDIHFVLEATGGYEKALTLALQKKYTQVSVMNPRHIRHFAKAMGLLAKNDRVDARLIALYAEKIQPKATLKMDHAQTQLVAYQTRYQQIQTMITAERNRLEHADHFTQTSIQRSLRHFEQELERIQTQINACLKAVPNLQHQVTLLQTIKGVGPKVATAVMAYLSEIGTLSHKHLASLAGVAPFACDSGQKRGTRSTWGGRAPLRAALYMSALVAIRYNPVIKQFYERLIKAGKKPMVAIVACMRKLLSIMNAIIKHNQPWCDKLAI